MVVPFNPDPIQFIYLKYKFLSVTLQWHEEGRDFESV